MWKGFTLFLKNLFRSLECLVTFWCIFTVGIIFLRLQKSKISNLPGKLFLISIYTSFKQNIVSAYMAIYIFMYIFKSEVVVFSWRWLPYFITWKLLYVLKKCFDRVVVLVLSSGLYILWRLWLRLSLSHILNLGFLFDWNLFLPLSHHFL